LKLIDDPRMVIRTFFSPFCNGFPPVLRFLCTSAARDFWSVGGLYLHSPASEGMWMEGYQSLGEVRSALPFRPLHASQRI